MACKPDMALLMTASGSLAHRRTLAEISLKLNTHFISLFVKNNAFI